MTHFAADVAGAYNCIKLLDNEEFAKKKGSILITGGGFAMHPYAGFLPLSMDKAALRAMVQALAQVTNVIGSNDQFAPLTIAEEFWKLYTKQETNEIIY